MNLLVEVHLHAAKIFAFPSITSAETFGIAQIEAMSVGLPIVNTSLPTGVSNVARHGVEALTVPPNDPDAFALALRRLLDDAQLAGRLGRAGSVRAWTEYGQAGFVSNMRRVYLEAHAGRTRASIGGGL